MNTKSIIAGVLAGVTFFILAGLIYGLLLESTFAGMAGSAKDCMKSTDELNMPFLALGTLFWEMLIAYIFSNWAKISTFAGGIKAGVIVGLLAQSAFDFNTYATSNLMTLQGAVLDIVVTAFIVAIAGGVAGWWLGRE